MFRYNFISDYSIEKNTLNKILNILNEEYKFIINIKDNIKSLIYNNIEYVFVPECLGGNDMYYLGFTQMHNQENRSDAEYILIEINNIINSNYSEIGSPVYKSTEKYKTLIKGNLLERNINPNLNPEPINKKKILSEKEIEEKLNSKFNLIYPTENQVLEKINEENNYSNSNCLTTTFIDQGANITLVPENGIVNCGNTCFAAAGLHLFAPILANALANTGKINLNNIIFKFDNSIINDRDIINGITLRDIKNIVNETIIPLIIGPTDPNLFAKLYRFTSLFLELDIKNIYENYITIERKINLSRGNRIVLIRISENKFNIGSQQDSSDFLIKLIDNLSCLGYCFKYSIKSLVKKDIFSYKNGKIEIGQLYINESIDTKVYTNRKYSLQTNITDYLNEFIQIYGDETSQDYKLSKLVNYPDQLPTFIINTIKLFDFSNRGIKNKVCPNKLSDIEIYGIEYELTDIICHLGDSVNSGHYICYSKRYYDGKQTWILYNDSAAVIKKDLNEIYSEINAEKCHKTPYIYLFKKKFINEFGLSNLFGLIGSSQFQIVDLGKQIGKPNIQFKPQLDEIPINFQQNLENPNIEENIDIQIQILKQIEEENMRRQIEKQIEQENIQKKIEEINKKPDNIEIISFLEISSHVGEKIKEFNSLVNKPTKKESDINKINSLIKYYFTEVFGFELPLIPKKGWTNSSFYTLERPDKSDVHKIILKYKN